MNHIRIGITSPLAGEQIPVDDMEAAHHRRALERIGAEPIILRKDMEPLRIVDELGLQGIVFSGGGDISAARYGGDETLANDNVDSVRDAFEFALQEYALKNGLPVLGICRGMQIANVLLGGTLIEDIRHHLGAGHTLPHHQVKDTGLLPSAYSHEITVVSGTTLHALARAERVSINSFHHQALGRVALALQVTARADDGVIEAVEFARGHVAASGYGGFFLGIQWHPERLPEDQLSQTLYTRFLKACTVTQVSGIPGCAE